MADTNNPIISRPKNAHRKKSLLDRQAELFLKDVLAMHKKKLMIAWGLDTLSVLVLIGFAWVLSGAFDVLLNLQVAGDLTQAKPVIENVLPILFGCLMVRLALTSVRESILSGIGNQIAMGVRALALKAVGALGLARRQFGADGALASHLVREPDELLGYARFSVQKMTAVSTPMIIGLVVASVSLYSACILAITVPLVIFFMIMIGIKTAQKSRTQLDVLAQMSGRFLDWLRGVNTLTRLSAMTVASDDIERASKSYKTATMSVLKIAFLNSTVLEFFSAISIALVAVYLGFGLMGLLPWSKGVAVVDYHTALFVLLLVPEFYLPLRRLGAEYHAKSAAVACAKVLAPIIASSPAPKNSSQPIENCDISLENLSVTTNGRTRLDRTTLTITAGQKWAIMGESGVGKSTLFEVLLGVVDYDGSAKIGAIEIKTCDMHVNHSKIGYLPQTPALLPISIADNLRLAKSCADDDEIVQILHKVGLAEILQLPNGINTILSERGGGLSGGQAQRLAIAQLLLQNADIWLLDEPTEHLDSDTKADIHALLHQFSQTKTVLWITHDAPVSWLDGVYVIEKKQHHGGNHG